MIEAEIPTGIPNAGSLFTFFIYNWYGTKGFNESFDTTKSDFLLYASSPFCFGLSWVYSPVVLSAKREGKVKCKASRSKRRLAGGAISLISLS